MSPQAIGASTCATVNSLVRISELKVAARTSAFSFKAKEMEIGDIARKPNVGAILEGSVRKSGEQVRINVKLVNAVNGYHLWSQTYDRELNDIFEVQADIAASVVQQLQATGATIARQYDFDWAAAEVSLKRARELEPSNAAVLRGAALLAETLGRFDESATLLRQALERDPLPSTGHTDLGRVLLGAGKYVAAEASFRKTLEINPELLAAHAGSR